MNYQDLFSIDASPRLYSLIDQRLFLPNKMLLKSDRAGMLESVESRSPFLDLIFLELNNVVDNKEPKKLLKSELNKFLPKYPLRLKKEGFFSPYKLIFNSNPIRSLIDSDIFSDIDEMIGLPEFSTRFSKENFDHNNNKIVPNSFWNYLALAKWIQLNIL